MSVIVIDAERICVPSSFEFSYSVYVCVYLLIFSRDICASRLLEVLKQVLRLSSGDAVKAYYQHCHPVSEGVYPYVHIHARGN